MAAIKLFSYPEQVAAHLRAELVRGRWSETMPGEDRLAVELGVNRKTVVAALQELERQGWLISQGLRRKRRIVQPEGAATRPLRVAIQLYEKGDVQRDYIIKLSTALSHAGHTVVAPAATLTELKMDPARVSQLVKKTPADAWVVMGGAREVLQWFSAQAKPVFALFGRREGLPIAALGPNYQVATVAAVRHLAGLGHRRIVMLCRQERRLPTPGPPECAFNSELKLLGLPVSEYNLPAWEESAEGLRNLLISLFQVTPPTALIIDEPNGFIPTCQFLAERGIQVPQQVSIINTDDHPYLIWCMPVFAHYEWDSSKVVPRIVRWAATISRGRRDVRQTLVAARFIAGGSTGPVNRSS